MKLYKIKKMAKIIPKELFLNTNPINGRFVTQACNLSKAIKRQHKSRSKICNLYSKSCKSKDDKVMSI